MGKRFCPLILAEEIHTTALHEGGPGAGQRHPAGPGAGQRHPAVLPSFQGELSRQLGPEAAVSHPNTGKR